jgi:hypothetical protein
MDDSELDGTEPLTVTRRTVANGAQLEYSVTELIAASCGYEA